MTKAKTTLPALSPEEEAELQIQLRLGVEDLELRLHQGGECDSWVPHRSQGV